MTRKRFKTGDYFSIPLDARHEALGQVLSIEPEALNSVGCAFWPIGETARVPVSSRPYEVFRAKSWIGAKVTGSGIVEDLLRAFHGLRYWDDYHDPAYLNSLLLPGISTPDAAIFKPRP